MLKNYIKDKEIIYKEIKSIKKSARTFKNTILRLESSDQEYGNIFNQIANYGMTAKDKT